ncbi:class I SAM-dependent methyltransferase [Haloferax profundi]|uniref:SAM-dependent methyltransferase n=1 Tax=Haloferax profundi TaxID=1544718 RepID=A0A0W1SWS4_9EURY|nr:methyltransferase domain-containing protein [Haloferax profundi]KTG30909.1 SAM-dependent methyltransferase [Haloferax profundi]
MGFHTFDADAAAKLDDPARYRYVSREELLSFLGPGSEDVVADLGSGTGFFTDDVAPYVDELHAVDVQEEMHDFYREKGAPENVAFVTADVASLPFDDDYLDGAFSTMTYHEFATDDAMAELARVVRPGGTVVVVDWSTAGEGQAGPPTDERFGLADAIDAFESVGFTVTHGETRRETFVCVARR